MTDRKRAIVVARTLGAASVAWTDAKPDIRIRDRFSFARVGHCFAGYAPHAVASAAGIHAWTIGGLGTMEIAVMSSMIRRHSGRAFAKSSLATAAFLLMTLSCLARLSAELTAGDPAFWISLSGGL